MIDPDKLKYKVNYNHSLYNFKTGRYESKRYTSAINRLRPISGSARNVKGYYLLKHLKMSLYEYTKRTNINSITMENYFPLTMAME